MPQTFSNETLSNTEYIVPPPRVAKKPAPEPAFSPIEIYDYNNPRAPNIPLSLGWHNPLALFKLFLNNLILLCDSYYSAKLLVEREPVISQILIDICGLKPA